MQSFHQITTFDDLKAIFYYWTSLLWLYQRKVTVMKVIFTLCLSHYNTVGTTEWSLALFCLWGVIFSIFFWRIVNINVVSKWIFPFKKERGWGEIKLNKKSYLIWSIVFKAEVYKGLLLAGPFCDRVCGSVLEMDVGYDSRWTYVRLSSGTTSNNMCKQNHTWASLNSTNSLELWCEAVLI